MRKYQVFWNCHWWLIEVDDWDGSTISCESFTTQEAVEAAADRILAQATVSTTVYYFDKDSDDVRTVSVMKRGN